ncbi:MAG: PilZ domain-containing protein [Deltaproteobacteria bacterium]|nr:PilZ domain-containing protein [Deltaproteobacteria bacterium]
MKHAHASRQAPTRFPVRYQSSDGHDVEAEAEQLNEKGMFIHTQAASPVNSMLTLQVTLPGTSGVPIRATASVIYSNPFRPFVPSALPPGMGVKFTMLADSDRQRIFDFVNALTTGVQEIIKVDLGNKPQRRIPQPVQAAAPIDALDAAANAALGFSSARPKDGKKSEAARRGGRGPRPEAADEPSAGPEPFWTRLWKKLNQPVGGDDPKAVKGKSARPDPRPKRPKGKS